MNNITYLKIPKLCPLCGEPTEILESDSGTLNLVCINPTCEGKLINRLEHFCSKKGLDIKGLSKATLEKLIDWGWVNEIKDLYFLKEHEKEWINKPGFGVASVTKILHNIEESKRCGLAAFISSLGVPLIGQTASKQLANYFKGYGVFLDAIDEGFHFYTLPNFGIEMHNSIVNFDWDKIDNLIRDCEFMIENVLVKETATDLSDLNVVITGKLKHYKKRDDLKAEIEARGGKVSGSVSAKTTLLINNDIDSTTGKNKDAKSRGIPILTEEEFLEKYLNS